MLITSIADIQGDSFFSPKVNQTVVVEAIVTAYSRKGFFIQQAQARPNEFTSVGIFVYSPRHKPELDAWVRVSGVVTDFRHEERDKPTTQIVPEQIQSLNYAREEISCIWLDNILALSANDQTRILNGLEGMKVGVKGGAVFISGSNPFGDYCLAPKSDLTPKKYITKEQGRIIDPENPERWYPSFRVTDKQLAEKLNVGATLTKPIVGALNYRAQSYQIAVNEAFVFVDGIIDKTKASFASTDVSITVMTVNAFNLDQKIESKEKVKDARRDIDDDIGDKRFLGLASDIVTQASAPDIIALQEIQDNDGAEISEMVDASSTYERLIRAIGQYSHETYKWVDLPPTAHEDGGQPGGNIRNGFLYNANRVELVTNSVSKLGANNAAFDGSRKPLLARFKHLKSAKELTVINVHLASKRHQHGPFAVENPGYDPKLATRVEQAELIRSELQKLYRACEDYYVTGDFNDTEFSETMAALCGQESVNLVETLPINERYDYNHRGKLQVLMHGIVSRKMLKEKRCVYQILHGNELTGVQPGSMGEKPSDHAYVIAHLK